MSEYLARRRAKARHAVKALVASLLALGGTYALFGVAPVALGAQPLGPACWGPTKAGCASQRGPIGGNLSVSGGVVNMVYDFSDSQTCLGVSNGLENQIQVSNSMRVDKSGAFVFAGKGTLVLAPERVVPVKIHGRFVTSKLAKVILTIDYKRCGTVHLTLRYPG